jgi:hypothetical protein
VALQVRPKGLITNQVLYQLSYTGSLPKYQAPANGFSASEKEMLLAAAVVALLAPGDPLPRLEGEFLTGGKAVVPDAARGKAALLALGFTYDSRFAVEDWIRRFRADFGADPRVTFFEVPMIGGMARLGKWFIDSGMRRGTPQADHEHVITVYGGVEPWKKRLRFGAPDHAYLILIDAEGRVRWLHQGPFAAASYDDLARTLRTLLRPATVKEAL